MESYELSHGCHVVFVDYDEYNDEVMTLVIKEEGHDQFNLPGGKIWSNECIADCIGRELKEELGIDVEIGSSSDIYFSPVDGRDVDVIAMLYGAATSSYGIHIESMPLGAFINVREWDASYVIRDDVSFKWVNIQPNDETSGIYTPDIHPMVLRCLGAFWGYYDYRIEEDEGIYVTCLESTRNDYGSTPSVYSNKSTLNWRDVVDEADDNVCWRCGDIAFVLCSDCNHWSCMGHSYSTPYEIDDRCIRRGHCNLCPHMYSGNHKEDRRLSLSRQMSVTTFGSCSIM
jgi:8-oxo-dGTP pyrophosphatase MutT (NUDIX family)